MTHDRNPQAQQMGDESMVRNLSYQAEAIWPQEQHLFDRYALAGPLRILDLGCGTGEITRRRARRYPDAQVVGVDILQHTVELARRVSADLGDRVSCLDPHIVAPARLQAACSLRTVSSDSSVNTAAADR